jgi:hypothetical protein
MRPGVHSRHADDAVAGVNILDFDSGTGLYTITPVCGAQRRRSGVCEAQLGYFCTDGTLDLSRKAKPSPMAKKWVHEAEDETSRMRMQLERQQ